MHRKIEFKVKPNSMLGVLIEDKLIPDFSFDFKVLREAIRAKQVSPIMQEGIMKNLKRKLEDSGLSLQPDELRFILNRLEREFDPNTV